MPPEGVKLIPHQEVLRFEEIERVVRAAVAAGAHKVRITGGEPLVRRGILELIQRLARVPGLQDLPLTTNGVWLAEMAAALKPAGLNRVTVSLDTLQPDRYERITGQPWLGKVLAGIAAAQSAGLSPVKINVVVVPGVNDDEVLDFVRLGGENDLEVRFIERMPIIARSSSPHCGMSAMAFLPSAQLRQRIEAAVGALILENGSDLSQPARVFQRADGQGRIGFIGAISEPFCEDCDRMRLTPDGKLRACLASEVELDVKGPLRRGLSDAELLALYQKAVDLKPKQSAACFAPGSRVMSQIGG